MKLQEIREIAKRVGLAKAASLKKVELVREIQRQEGNFDCFATAHNGHCDQSGCMRRADCLKDAVAVVP